VRKADITVAVVRCLIAGQFPQWEGLPVRPVVLDGWDNTTFRLGEELSVRLPSDAAYVPQIDKEHRWLPVLAPLLPRPIPEPVAKGRPDCGFPRPWSIYRWLPGEPVAVAGIEDPDGLAVDLAAFLRALHAAPADGGPPPGSHSFGRGGPVSVWGDEVQAAIAGIAGEVDSAGAIEVWEAALAAPWVGPDVWVHGDVTGSNLLVRGGRLCGVIDFGCCAVGDPACDLTPAWTMFDGTARDRFRSLLAYDEGTWARARGWALWKAAIVTAGRSASSPERTGTRFGWARDAASVVAHVIDDHRNTRLRSDWSGPPG